MTLQPTRHEESPEELLSRFRERGEVEALGALFDQVSPILFRMALALAPDPASGEDAVQETFLTLMAPTTHYDPSRPLVPWMVGVLQMKVHEVRRRVRRTPDPTRLPPPMFPEDPSVAAESGEEVERVREALDALPQPYRSVALLRWRYGLEPAAIADVRGDPPGTVRSLLHRAQEKLRESLRVLPAIIAGPRIPRGTDAVRTAVLREGAAVAAAAGVAGAAASAVILGGTLMSSKALVAAAALLLLVGAGWLSFRSREVPSAPPAPPAVTPSTGKVHPPAPTPPPSPPVPMAQADSELPPPVDLSKCDRDLDLFGTTVDDAGKPVPGAIVETVRFPWRRSGMGGMKQYYAEEKGPSTRSAVDGTFVIRLARGEVVDLRATAEGLGQGDLVQCLAGERVTLVLRRGGSTVRVTVLDEARGPVAGARLRFWVRSPDSVYSRNLFSREGTTDAAGHCEFPHLQSGKGILTVDHPVLGQPGWQMPDVPAEGNLDIEVVLPAGRTISGRITDASTGKPIPGAQVGSNWVMDRPVTADAEGRYSFPGWTGKGVSVLTAAAEGYGSSMQKVPDVGNLDFNLDPAFQVTGRILSAEGDPVAGGRVAASGHWQDGGRSGSDRASVCSSPDGRFVLADLSRRTRHDLVAEAGGHGRVFLAFEAPAEGEMERDLGDVALAPARAIEGRALDPSGGPLAGKDVNLARLKPADDPAWRETRGSGAVAGMGEVRRTDDLGRFRFPDLSPGRWGLKLVVPGSPIVETEVDLPADRDILDVVLAEKGHSIAFVVTDSEGKPLKGIGVQTEMNFPHPTSGVQGMTSLQAVTDAVGHVEFRSLPDVPKGGKGIVFTFQPYTGTTAPPWASHRTEPLVPAGQVVRVVLRPAASIRGKVLGPEDEPIPGLYVSALRPDGEVLGGAVAACDARGEFELRVPAGETVTIRAPGHKSVEIREGAFSAVDTGYRAELAGVTAPVSGVLVRATRLASDRALDILVLDMAGRPVKGFPVHAWRSMGGENRNASTDDAGRIRWEGMMEDAWTILPDLRVPEGMGEDAVPPAKVEVVPRGQEVVLRFRRGVAVEGVVLRTDGSPAQGAGLGYNLEGGGGGPVRPQLTGEDGRFRVFFGEGDKLKIGAAWSDGKGGSFHGESELIRVGQTGQVEIRLQPSKGR